MGLDMSAHLSALLIFTGLSGIHSIMTVRKVSVKAGGSISVPCLYESEYKNNVKYLCKGYEWVSCLYTVRTDHPRTSGRYSISDDKQQRIFTVNIKDVTSSELYFWCAVEIKDWGDLKTFFRLSVTTGRPLLSVDQQKVTGFIGEDLTIFFNYYISGEIWWCRLGRSCVKEPHGSIDGSRVSINAYNAGVFTVTLRGLSAGSSGWYYCVKGDLQIPVHVTVKERERTTTPATTTRLNTVSSTRPPVDHTSVSAYEEHSTVQAKTRSAPFNPLIFIISVSLIIIMVALVFWLILRHYKSQPPTAEMGEQEVAYSAISHMRPRTNTQHRAQEGNVTYSTLALH